MALHMLSKQNIKDITIGSYVMLYNKEELIKEYGINPDTNNIDTPIIQVNKEMEKYLGKVLVVRSIINKNYKDISYVAYKFNESGNLWFTKEMIKIVVTNE